MQTRQCKFVLLILSCAMSLLLALPALAETAVQGKAGESSKVEGRKHDPGQNRMPRMPWYLGTPVECKKKLQIDSVRESRSAGPSIREGTRGIQEYKEELDKGCIQPMAIQQHTDPYLWGSTHTAGKGLKNPVQVDYKTFAKECGRIMYAVNDALRIKSTVKSNVDLAKYQEKCITRFPSGFDPQDKEYFDLMSSGIGVLRYTNSSFIHCTAFQVTPRTVLTAIHCLNDPKNPGQLISGKGIAFRPYDQHEKDFYVVSINLGVPEKDVIWYLGRDKGATFGRVGDYALLEVDSDLPNHKGLIPLAQDYKQLHPQLVIPGFHGWLAYPELNRTSKERQAYVLSNWKEFLYWDNSGACQREITSNEQCIHHSCSTVDGFSGAPIFAYSEKTQSVVNIGVHSGVVRDVSCELPPKSQGKYQKIDFAVPNVGSQPSIEWIENQRIKDLSYIGQGGAK